MEKFTKLEGVAAPVKMINVDTDMIIPADYLKTLKRTGLAKGLFSRIRRLADGNLDPEFALNKPAYKDAKILVAGDNFGCGSSREHAPWALLDAGIQQRPGCVKQEIHGPDGGVVKFDIDPHRKHCLLNGLDDIGQTNLKKAKIESFEAKSKAERPWI